MPNTFPARDKAFISGLTEDLHLSLTWDEYDEEDQNIVTIEFPVSYEGSGEETTEDKSNDEWEDANDVEGNDAVDRVLKKYDKMKIAEADSDDSDVKYEKKLRERMDAWKRQYYLVRD